jgi:hypothetical protein
LFINRWKPHFGPCCGFAKCRLQARIDIVEVGLHDRRELMS